MRGPGQLVVATICPGSPLSGLSTPVADEAVKGGQWCFGCAPGNARSAPTVIDPGEDHAGGQPHGR